MSSTCFVVKDGVKGVVLALELGFLPIADESFLRIFADPSFFLLSSFFIYPSQRLILGMKGLKGSKHGFEVVVPPIVETVFL